MITQLFQTLAKDANHLVCGLLVDVAKPVLDVQANHLLHHAFMGDTGWITIRVAVTSSRVVHCSMARCIGNVNQYLIEEHASSLDYITIANYVHHL